MEPPQWLLLFNSGLFQGFSEENQKKEISIKDIK
jgi:hypothetical protein